MSVRSAQSVTVDFTTRVFATGVATNADSLPAGTLVVNGTDNGASVTVTNVGTGYYKAAVTLPTLAVNDIVQIRIAATVSSVADVGIIWTDTKDVFAGAIPDVAAGGTNGLFIAGTNAATAIATGLTAHIIGTVDTVTTVTNQLTAAQIATGVWQDTTAGDFTVASSIGKSLFTSGVVPGGSGGLFISGSNSGTTTFGALTVTGATTLAAFNATNVSFSGTFQVGGLTTLNALNVTTDLQVQNKLSAVLFDLGTLRTVDLTVTGASSFAGIITASNASNNIAVNVTKLNNTSIAGTSTRVADSFVTMFNVASPVFTVASVNQTGDAYLYLSTNLGLLGANLSSFPVGVVRTAVGMASANLDTQLGAIVGYIDTEVAAIKAKTDNLPASPAAVGSAMTLASGAITAAVIATDAIDADALAQSAIDEIAAALETSDLTGITATLAEIKRIVQSRGRG